MKLEHLAPYLPYGLKLYGASDIWVMRSLGIEEVCISNGRHTQTLSYDDCFTNYSPILRPLSDLTKEIEHNGEKFVPMKKLKTGGTNNDSVYTVEDWNGTNYVCCDSENHELRFSEKTGFDRRYNYETRQIYAYDLFQKLLEWHFDVFGLIEKGEAIDINKLEI